MADSNCWQHLLAYRQGLSEAHQKGISDAVDKLKEGVSAHAKGRELFSPDTGWENISQRSLLDKAQAIQAFRWNEQIRKLEWEIAECAGVIIDARAEAFWHVGAAEPFRKLVETDALDIFRRVLACIDSRDLPSLDQASLRVRVDGIVSKWLLKAQLEFPPILPSPVDDGSLETGSPLAGLFRSAGGNKGDEPAAKRQSAGGSARASKSGRRSDSKNEVPAHHAQDDSGQSKRGKIRAAWLDKKRSDREWTSDLDIVQNGGPTYNPIRRYRSGRKSTRDAYVRGKLAKAFGCEISEVPE
jgi:hypothetical protein